MPIAVWGKRKAKRVYNYFINMQQSMGDIWEDADHNAPKGSPDAKEDSYIPDAILKRVDEMNDDHAKNEPPVFG